MPDWPGAQDLLDRLEAQIAGPAADDDGWWTWAPLPLLDFYEGMGIVRRTLGPGRHRLLEVGAGIGSKLHLAAILGFDAHGIERHPRYVEVARRMFPEVALTVGDALTYDGYDWFDVIYSYRIAFDPVRQEQVNRTITARMRTGGLFFCAGGPYPDWLDHVDGQVWRA